MYGYGMGWMGIGRLGRIGQGRMDGLGWGGLGGEKKAFSAALKEGLVPSISRSPSLQSQALMYRL